MRSHIFIFTVLLLAPLAALHAAELKPATVSSAPVVLQREQAVLVRGADARVQPEIRMLTECGLIASADDWQTQLGAEKKIDGAKVAALLVKMAQCFKPVTTTQEAIAVLTQRGVIGSSAYWTKNAVAGGVCDGANVAIVLERVVSRLPKPPPKSFQAVPLEAVKPSALKQSYDIIIAGAGTGGCGAAVQAARMGRSVLLIEETDWIGGQMNAAAVTSMDEGLALVRERGLYRELCGLISAHYQPLGIDSETAYWHRHPAVEPRVGRVLLLKMLGDARGSGVLDLVLRSRVTKVRRHSDTVTGIALVSITEKGPETRSIESKVLIDATEWGDVIPLAGARYRAGNCTSDAIDRAKHIQDLTWTAVVKEYPNGVPAELRVDTPPPGYETLAKRFRKAMTVGDTNEVNPPVKGQPWSWNWFIGYRGMPNSARPPQGRLITRTHLNHSNDYPVTVADLEDPATRLKTFHKAIVDTLCLLHFIQKELCKTKWSVANDEGFDSPFNREQMDSLIVAQPELAPYRAILYHFSVIAYARESRRIVGLHTLIAREIERKPGKPIQFAHTVAVADYAVDMHGSMTPEYLESDFDRAEDIPHKFGERGIGPFSIPFECFIPEKIDGFLPAEKNLSQSRMANGATRLQPSTLLTGQAAGAIAALAVQHRMQPRALDPALVQRVLLDAGATLSILPVKAAWGTPEWREQQMNVLKTAER